MDTQMIIRIDPNLKTKVSQLAKTEGKNLSELVRELLIKYTKDRDMSSYIDNLWNIIGQKFAKTNVSETDIEKTIKEVRYQNAQSCH